MLWLAFPYWKRMPDQVLMNAFVKQISTLPAAVVNPIPIGFIKLIKKK